MECDKPGGNCVLLGGTFGNEAAHNVKIPLKARRATDATGRRYVLYSGEIEIKDESDAIGKAVLTVLMRTDLRGRATSYRLAAKLYNKDIPDQPTHTQIEVTSLPALLSNLSSVSFSGAGSTTKDGRYHYPELMIGPKRKTSGGSGWTKPKKD